MQIKLLFRRLKQGACTEVLFYDSIYSRSVSLSKIELPLSPSKCVFIFHLQKIFAISKVSQCWQSLDSKLSKAFCNKSVSKSGGILVLLRATTLGLLEFPSSFSSTFLLPWPLWLGTFFSSLSHSLLLLKKKKKSYHHHLHIPFLVPIAGSPCYIPKIVRDASRLESGERGFTVVGLGGKSPGFKS